jgi:ribonucleotide reductase beta subunit family protein with ferritin-like domain
MSLINYSHTGKKQPLFFGEEPALQRYDSPQYPILEKLYDTQNGYFWNPSEISLQKDRGDFAALSNAEKHIFSSNLKYQILLDSMQSRGVLEFLPLVSNSELESLIIIWSFFETIHSKSYSHIIRSIYADPSEVFDTTLNTEEIITRAKSVTNYYDQFVEAVAAWNSTSLPALISDGNQTAKTDLLELKRLLYLAIVNVNILEGIRFYTSFACSFVFAENKKMIGNSDIISLIARDEACYITGTEILTPNGWKLLDDVDTNDRVMQYKENGEVEFVNPTAVMHQHYKSGLYKFVDSNGRFEQIVTYDHRMIWRNPKTKQIQETLSQDMVLSSKDIIATGLKLTGRSVLTPVEVLNICFFYYGSLVSSKTTDTEIACKFILPPNARLLLNTAFQGLSINAKNAIANSNGDFTEYNVLIPREYFIPYFAWLDLNDTNYIAARHILELCNKFGNKVNTTSTPKFRLRLYNRHVINKLQQIATISGWAHKLYSQKDGGITMEIDKCKDSYHIQSASPAELIPNYNGFVHCVSVPSGMIVVRYNGKVSVGGNCHLKISEEIIKTLKNDGDDDMKKIIKDEESTVVEMYKTAVAEEKQWANYLFQYGSVLGLNATLTHQYIEFLANRRIKAIGMQPIFDISNKNPLPWMDNYLKSGNVTVAPQESEILSYLIGSSNPDVDSNTFANFVL